MPEGSDAPLDKVLRPSLRAQLAELRGVPAGELPPALLDIRVERLGDAYVVRPRDWEQLRHEEGGAGRPVPYWATPWPSGRALAAAVSADPPPAGTRVLELGCGLALPSIAAGRAGAHVLATDGHTDAVAFAAHSLALNEVAGEAAVVDWAQHGDALAAAARGISCWRPTCSTCARTSRRRCGCSAACSRRTGRSCSPIPGARARATSSPPRARLSGS